MSVSNWFDQIHRTIIDELITTSASNNNISFVLQHIKNEDVEIGYCKYIFFLQYMKLNVSKDVK